jgi:hypothetical protein
VNRSVFASPVRIDLPGGVCPPDVRVWLEARGWHASHIDGHEGFSNSYGEQCHNFTWEQAVAYEFYRFASLGGMPLEG